MEQKMSWNPIVIWLFDSTITLFETNDSENDECRQKKEISFSIFYFVCDDNDDLYIAHQQQQQSHPHAEPTEENKKESFILIIFGSYTSQTKKRDTFHTESQSTSSGNSSCFELPYGECRAGGQNCRDFPVEFINIYMYWCFVRFGPRLGSDFFLPLFWHAYKMRRISRIHLYVRISNAFVCRVLISHFNGFIST